MKYSHEEFHGITIASGQNPKIKSVLRLRDRRHRDRQGKTLVEGYRELRTAVDNRYIPELLFFCPSFFLGKNEETLLADLESAGTTLLCTTENVFAKISYRDRPDGLLGVAAKVGQTLDELQPQSISPLILIAESVEKPGNLGSMLRSADGVGADAVVVCDPKTDVNNPNVVRASVGTLFSIPVIEATSKDTTDYLIANDYNLIITSPAANDIYWSADYRGPTAIIVGSEQYGLSEAWLKLPGRHVRIPMHGTADSLNVATAATILLYEAVRQRTAGTVNL